MSLARRVQGLSVRVMDRRLDLRGRHKDIETIYKARSDALPLFVTGAVRRALPLPRSSARSMAGPVLLR